MPEQYVVPQFIDVEDKILGPLTVRQFVIMLAVGGSLFIFYKLFSFGLFLLVGIPIFALGITLAFVKINGQPFHLFLLNILQTRSRPAVRVWNKELTVGEVKQFLTEPPVPPPPPQVRKEPLATNKLSEISLIVNTGGVYRPEDYA